MTNKSDEVRKEMETLVSQFNQIIEKEKKTTEQKQKIMMEVQKLQGKYEVYKELEKEVPCNNKVIEAEVVKDENKESN